MGCVLEWLRFGYGEEKMLSETAVFAVVLTLAGLTLFALPLPPADSDSPPHGGRTRRGGVNRRKLLEFLVRGSRATVERCTPGIDALLLVFFRAYCGLCEFLFKLGAPAWVVNAPRCFIPDMLMRAAAKAYEKNHTK